MHRHSRSVILLLSLLLTGVVGACAQSETDIQTSNPAPVQVAQTERTVPADAAEAVFAGGCFWCMEEAYQKVPGVYDAVSGYAGGRVANPSYRQVVNGGTGHREVVKVYYDPDQVSYEELLYVFWRNVDLVDDGGQFCDRGFSYTTGIYYMNEEQRRLAEESKQQLEESNRFSSAIVTPIEPLDVIDADANDGFWVAEDYHQEYYQTNPVRYRFYKQGCGRVRRLQQLWGDEAEAPSVATEQQT
jgi:peptide-methionine (S)-S-oxide reductase